MKLNFFQFAKRAFFWVPMLLALIDLLFFIVVPVLIAIALNEGAVNTLQKFLGITSKLLSVTIPQLTLVLVGILAFARVLSVKFVGEIFAKSLSRTYVFVSRTFAEEFFQAISKVQLVDVARYRKLMNAETNNLFFGVLVSVSFAFAEAFVLLVAIVLLIVLLGLDALLIFFPVAAFMLLASQVMKAQAARIGQARSRSEQKRLEAVEIQIRSGYSIRINGGAGEFQQKFSKVTYALANALSRQLALPFFTKSVVDAILIVIMTALLIFYVDVLSSLDVAVLVGVGLRCVPALSRFAAYVETARINKVGAMDALSAESDLRGSETLERQNPKIDKFLVDISSPGLVIIKGPSGTGKTTAVKKWVSAGPEKTYAYFDQGGFAPDSRVDDVASLLDVSGAVDYNEIQFLKGRSDIRLGDLSGGQARFVQLFSLLAKEVDCFVLDEPSVGLDNDLRKSLESMLLQKSQAALVVVISHDDDFISMLTGFGGKLFEV